MPEFINTKNAAGDPVKVSVAWVKRWPEDYPDATRQLQQIPVEPPRSGRGSGDAAWLAYAQSRGIEVPDGASREDIQGLVDAGKGVAPEVSDQ